MNMNLAPLSAEDLAGLDSCSVKGCDAPSEWMPQLTIYCKGPKGRGKDAKGMTTYPPTPMCSKHRHLPTARDYLKHIDWPGMIARFNALDLPGPRRSSAKLEWIRQP